MDGWVIVLLSVEAIEFGGDASLSTPANVNGPGFPPPGFETSLISAASAQSAE